MECICCCSDKTIYEPSGLKGYYRCLSCNFVFTVVTDTGNLHEDLVRHYEKVDPHERIAESKESFFSSVIDYLSDNHGTSEKLILDVGCGFGYFLELAARKGWQTFGVEIAHDAVQAARGKFGDDNIFQGTLRQAEYPGVWEEVEEAWPSKSLSQRRPFLRLLNPALCSLIICFFLRPYFFLGLDVAGCSMPAF